MTEQPGEEIPISFSFSASGVKRPSVSCYLTHTTEETHRIIRDNLSQSANYNGLITGEGPRHCPSIESKVVRFPGRARHKVFLEPEGRETSEVYLQGIYTAFPPEIQESIVHSVPGLERAHIERYGYDVEYDYVFPTQLHLSLELKGISGLFLAGQVNGTTGYEEAAAQGLVAGINAARAMHGEPPVVLSRGQAFLGVMIDDLVTKGIREPYRMLPSRAEYRITLRERNADLRLSEIGYGLGLLSPEAIARVRARAARIATLITELKDRRIGPGHPLNRILKARGMSPLTGNGASLFELLRRPELRLSDVIGLQDVPTEVADEVEIEAKYAGYLQQQESEIAHMRRLEGAIIPEDLDYWSLENLSIEGRDLLSRLRPRSFGQATRTPGVSQADLSMLAIRLRR